VADVPAIPPLPQPWSDDRVALRFSGERDIPEILIAHQDDPRLHMDLGADRPPSGAELGRQFEAATRERAAGIRVRLAILEPPADRCRGEVFLHGIDWEQARTSVGIWVAPDARGRGLGRRALRLTAEWAFGAWGLERLTLLTDADNGAMLNAAHGAGFTFEGVLRSYGRERGRRRDFALLSLLPGDPLPAAPSSVQSSGKVRR
jgi:ribosomal-protein-alanine N-acetyltransferase